MTASQFKVLMICSTCFTSSTDQQVLLTQSFFVKLHCRILLLAWRKSNLWRVAELPITTRCLLGTLWALAAMGQQQAALCQSQCADSDTSADAGTVVFEAAAGGHCRSDCCRYYRCCLSSPMINQYQLWVLTVSASIDSLFARLLTSINY